MMSPFDWAKRPIEKYADFSGRAPRPEYWWYTLALIVAFIVVGIVENLVGLDQMVGPYGLVSLLLVLGTFVPSLAVSVRRLHDSNRTGWWLLVALIPYGLMAIAGVMAMSGGGLLAFAAMMGLISIVALIGGIALLVFMVLPGTTGDNRFGPPSSGNGGSAVPAE